MLPEDARLHWIFEEGNKEWPQCKEFGQCLNQSTLLVLRLCTAATSSSCVYAEISVGHVVAISVHGCLLRQRRHAAAPDEWEVFSGRNTEPAFPSSLPINILGYAPWILIRTLVRRRCWYIGGCWCWAGHFFHHSVRVDIQWLFVALVVYNNVLTRPNHCHSFACWRVLEFFRVSSAISIAWIAFFTTRSVSSLWVVG